MKPITILLADDHAILREGLRALLKSDTDIAIIGEAENGRQAIALATELHPDVIVMDVSMPLLNGMEATRQLQQVCPSAKVLMLSSHAEDSYIERVMELGAYGYLNKQDSVEELPTAIRQVHRGELYFSAHLTPRQLTRFKQIHAGSATLAPMTPPLTVREAEVLQLIAEGQANKQTADELHLSVKTVEKHRQSLMAKLNLHNTASLTRHAVAHGLIDCSVQLV